MKTPKLGDQKIAYTCQECGTVVYATYTEVPAYHNDTNEEWSTNQHSCIKELVKKINKLERGGRVG